MLEKKVWTVRVSCRSSFFGTSLFEKLKKKAFCDFVCLDSWAKSSCLVYLSSNLRVSVRELCSRTNSCFSNSSKNDEVLVFSRQPFFSINNISVSKKVRTRKNPFFCAFEWRNLLVFDARRREDVPVSVSTVNLLICYCCTCTRKVYPYIYTYFGVLL